jgi:hypothetical protein
MPSTVPGWRAAAVNPDAYDEVDETDVLADAPRCSRCAPLLPIARRGPGSDPTVRTALRDLDRM